MKKLICLIATAGMILSTSGCATNCCSKGLFGGGLFQGGMFQNVRNPFENQPIRSFFRGAPCDTCNAPAGQVGGYGGNVAPLCESGTCGGHGQTVAPGGSIPLNGPVPYYDSGSNLGSMPAIQGTAPAYGVTPGSSNRITYGNDSLPSIEAFSGNVLDADSLPPSP